MHDDMGIGEHHAWVHDHRARTPTAHAILKPAYGSGTYIARVDPTRHSVEISADGVNVAMRSAAQLVPRLRVGMPNQQKGSDD
jgi:hypothetical protein